MRRSTARLHFAWRTTSLRVGGRAASRRRRSTDKRGSLVLSCLMSPCELSRPDRPTSAFCVGVRPAVAPTVPAPPDTERTCRAVGRLNSHLHTRHDKTVLSVSCPVWRCELDDCCERVQTSDFLSATALSCRECGSHSRSGRDTDKTVLSCLA